MGGTGQDTEPAQHQLNICYGQHQLQCETYFLFFPGLKKSEIDNTFYKTSALDVDVYFF